MSTASEIPATLTREQAAGLLAVISPAGFPLGGVKRDDLLRMADNLDGAIARNEAGNPEVAARTAAILRAYVAGLEAADKPARIRRECSKCQPYPEHILERAAKLRDVYAAAIASGGLGWEGVAIALEQDGQLRAVDASAPKSSAEHETPSAYHPEIDDAIDRVLAAAEQTVPDKCARPPQWDAFDRAVVRLLAMMAKHRPRAATTPLDTLRAIAALVATLPGVEAKSSEHRSWASLRFVRIHGEPTVILDTIAALPGARSQTQIVEGDEPYALPSVEIMLDGFEVHAQTDRPLTEEEAAALAPKAETPAIEST